MCLCVQLQDSPPSKDDPKYMDQARNALLAKMMSGQKITMRMLRKEAKKFHRREYQTWNKQHNRAKKRHARDEEDAPPSRPRRLEFAASDGASFAGCRARAG